MKKLAAAILLLIYFTVTTGFVVSVHYCMGKLDSVEIGYNSDEDCSNCGMNIQKSDGCCKDDVQVVKMQTDHQLAKTAFPDFGPAVLPANHYGYTVERLFNAEEFLLPLSNGPPLSGQEIYLRNCVFRL